MIKHLNITVTGKVQGVFYRNSTQKKGTELGLSGYVMNKGDGSVFIEAEGEEESLQKLVEWCHIGPLLAKVIAVDVEESTVIGFESFVVRR